VTVLKIQGKPSTAAQQALEPHIARLYARSGVRVMAVVELAHVERTEPAADADKDASVTMRIAHLELPNTDQEGAVRELQRALYLQRTATGKLTEDGDVELSESTIKRTGGLVQAIEVARLVAGARHWSDYIRRVVSLDKATPTELRHELDTIADGLAALVSGQRDGD